MHANIKTNEGKKRRCAVCNVRLGLIDFQCTSCKLMLCVHHRLIEDHECIGKSAYTLKARNNLQAELEEAASLVRESKLP